MTIVECPRCKSNKINARYSFRPAGGVQAVCQNCERQGPVRTTAHKAFEAWNKKWGSLSEGKVTK